MSDWLDVGVYRQFAKSKSSGLPVEMAFGVVFTLRQGRYVQMQGYATPNEALEAAELSE